MLDCQSTGNTRTEPLRTNRLWRPLEVTLKKRWGLGRCPPDLHCLFSLLPQGKIGRTITILIQSFNPSLLFYRTVILELHHSSLSFYQTSELEQLRTKLTKSMREKFRHEAEIGTLSAYVFFFLAIPTCMCSCSVEWVGILRAHLYLLINPGGWVGDLTVTLRQDCHFECYHNNWEFRNSLIHPLYYL